MVKKRKRDKFLGFISNLRPSQNQSAIPINLAEQSGLPFAPKGSENVASPSVHDSNSTNASNSNNNNNARYGTREGGLETTEAVDLKPLPDDISVITPSVKEYKESPESKLGSF
jgi:hypothetical protein